MTIHEQAQIELCLALLCTAAAVLSCAFYLPVRKGRVRPGAACWCVLALSIMAASYALTDGGNGKPVPHQVAAWMRMKSDWARWTKGVRAEWQQMMDGIETRFVSVQGLYGDVEEVTNSIPRGVPRAKMLQMRMDNLGNPRNQNIKSRVTALNDNGDGTWTVEVENSRAVSDEPSVMMCLRRRSDGAIWWVEHDTSSFPDNTAPNAYSYTFRMPVSVTGYLVVADEVLLGGVNGLQVEGIVLVDPVAGQMYEGVSGTYLFGDRSVTIKGGQFLLEPAPAAAETPAEELLAAPAPMMRAARFAAPAPKPRTIDLSMPPLDGGAE